MHALKGQQHITQGVASLALGYALLGFYRHYRLRLSNSSKLDCIRLAR